MITPKSTIIANINNEIVDNTEGKISPHDVRHNLVDIVDSVHLLLEDRAINTLNFSTPSIRSVKIGENALSNIALDGYHTIDNVAIGYCALKSNYQGEKNNALGSHALNCNIYGIANNAFGYNALGGNTTGNGNVGVGNNTLINNKIGDFNIAIGNAAGYYAARNTSYKLFIASHPVDSDYICDNPTGSGLIPLVYGDLNQGSLRFGIATNFLHAAATLQVSGGIAPTFGGIDNLGDDFYRFKNLYLSKFISFPSGKYIEYSDNGKFVINNDLYPSGSYLYNLGSQSNIWNSLHVNDLYVSGNAIIENYTAKQISNCLYECKTLYLASSGVCSSINGCGYLSDQQLTGAGFIVKASGSNYLRDYHFVYRPSGNNVIYVESNNPYSRSYWHSNISIHVDSGNYIKTDRILGSGKLSLVTDPSGYGLFINNNKAYFSVENIIPSGANNNIGQIASLGDVNFISCSSGNCHNYNVVVGSLESGVSISQKFVNGIKERNKDLLNNNKDKLSGFELKYIDDSNTELNNLSDRFVIKSFDKTSEGINNVILMKNYADGVFGINNFSTGGDALYPKTILNIRSKDNAVVRVTAENLASDVHSAIQLLGGSNCLRDGYEEIYYHNSGIVDINLYQDSGKFNIYRYAPYQVGLFSSGNLNSTLTIGASGFPRSSISIKDNEFTTGSIIATSGYGKIYNDKVDKLYAQQANALLFMDASGWIHDLTAINKFDVLDARALYSENIVFTPNISSGNTFGGYQCPSGRLTFINDRIGNTAYGSRALFSLASGDYNTVVGIGAGSGIVNGYENIVLGALSANSIGSGFKNIIIGNNSFNNTSGVVNNNIIIGNSIAFNHNSSNKLLIGNNANILVSGNLGPSIQDKVFALPSSGNFEIYDSGNINKLVVKHNLFNIYNTSGTYPAEQLKFNFSTPSGTKTLLTLDNSVAPSGSGNYACSGLPYAELNGNLKLLNNICFSDSTTLNSATFLSTIDNLESSGTVFNNRLNSLIIEGVANQDIINPQSPFSVPSSGSIKTKIKNQFNQLVNGPDVTIINRDKFLIIDKDSYVVALYINGEYRPIWVSSEALTCEACQP